MKKNKYYSLAILFVLPSLIWLGCQDKKSDNTQPSNPIITPNQYQGDNFCSLQQAAGDLLIQATSVATISPIGTSTGYELRMCTRILGSPGEIQKWMNFQKSPSYYYNGPISTQGSLYITGFGRLGSCVLPQGKYDIRVTGGGNFTPVSFSVPILEATSPAGTLRFQIKRGYVRDPDMDYMANGLYLEIRGMSFQQIGGEIQDCQDSVGLLLM